MIFLIIKDLKNFDEAENLSGRNVLVLVFSLE